MEALDYIVKSGRALYVGLSNYDGEQMLRASSILKELKTPFIINQNSYNMLNRTVENNGLLESAKKDGKGVICFSPLAQGVLTDKYLNGIPDDSRIKRDGRFLHESDVAESIISRVRELNRLAESRGQTMAQMALSWILRSDAVTSVLVGASRPAQILDCLKCLDNTSFTQEELKQIDRLTL